MKCVSEKCPFKDVNPKCCPYTGGCDFAKFEMTNADRIRAMTDEELAEFGRDQVGCGRAFYPCGVVCDGKCNSYSNEICRGKILEWLQQPYGGADRE